MPQSGYIKKIRLEMLGIIDFNEAIEKISEKFGEDKVKEFKESFEVGNRITEFSPLLSDWLFSVVRFEKKFKQRRLSTTLL